MVPGWDVGKNLLDLFPLCVFFKSLALEDTKSHWLHLLDFYLVFGAHKDAESGCDAWIGWL